MKVNISLVFSFFLIFNFFSQTQKPPAFVTKVYNDLFKNLYITKKVEKPELTYNAENKSVVVVYESGINGGKNKLIVGYEFVNLIRTFGSDSLNALAFVLGHEMAHIFLEQSGFIEKIGSGYADKTLKKELKDIKDTLYTNIFERQADEWAMYNAHVGGYKTTHIAEKVLNSVYQHFKLPSNLKGYPTLKERKIIASTSALKMKLLLERYELANLCLLSNHHDLAIKIYEAIIREGFKSTELYNNLGVGLLLKVIESDSIYQRYEWPIFLDSKSKLEANIQRDILGVSTLELLNQALENFKLAAEQKENKEALLNIAITHLLLGISEEDNEIDHLELCEEIISKWESTLPQFTTLKGIFYYQIGKQKEAKKLWGNHAKTFILSKRNLDRLFDVQQEIVKENPVFQKIDYSRDLIDFFWDSKGIIRDSVSSGSKPILPTFSLIAVDNKMDGTILCTRIHDKNSGEKVYIAKIDNSNIELNKKELEENASRIVVSNLYTYYIFKDWVVRLDASNRETIFKTN